MGLQQAALALDADLVEQDVPRLAQQVVVGHAPWSVGAGA
jgi:hypothetical protein